MLGHKARDKITGFEGVVIARAEYLFGCTQFGVAPLAKDGEVKATQWFDDGRLEDLGEHATANDVRGTSAGGPNRDSPPG